MKATRKLADNVMEFLSKATDDYGRLKAENFSQYIYSELTDGDTGSPIEDLFFIAINVMCEAKAIEVWPEYVMDEHTKELRLGTGLYIYPQHKVDRYRVDFLFKYVTWKREEQVVVELDGHDFHDKDKVQRAYEKRRDRFMVAHGLRVLHFTGSEVVADPYRAAFETLDVLVGLSHDEYDPLNPFGID